MSNVSSTLKQIASTLTKFGNVTNCAHFHDILQECQLSIVPYTVTMINTV